MRKRLEINKNHVTLEELKQIYNNTKNSNLKIRYLAILYFWKGMSSLEVADLLNKSDSTVRDWAHRFNKYGIDGLIPKKQPGKKCKLTTEQLDTIKQILQNSPRECDFNRSIWTIPLLKIWISKNMNIVYSISGLYALVHRLGFSIQRPKKQSKEANPEQQEEFKKKLKNLLEEDDTNTVVLYEDEMIITTEPTITATWSLKGKQPIVKTNSKSNRKRKVIFGAANPKESKVHYSTTDNGDSINFEAFLKQISNYYPNKKVILILDNVRYHYSKKVKEYIDKLNGQIELMFLPPYCSELNAIEHLWKDIRKSVTHNHVFNSIEEMTQAIRKYFMATKSSSAKIRKLCSFIC